MKKLISIIGLIGLVAFGGLIFAQQQPNKVSLAVAVNQEKTPAEKLKEYFIELELAQKGLREVENKPKSKTNSINERNQKQIITYKERITEAKKNIKKAHNKNLQKERKTLIESIQQLESAEIDTLKLEVKELENNAWTILQEWDKLQNEYLTKIKKLEGEVADKFKEYKELFNQSRGVFKKDDEKIMKLEKQLKQKPKEVKVEVIKEVKSKPEIVIEYKDKEVIKYKDKDNTALSLGIGIGALVLGSFLGGSSGILLMKLRKGKKNE